MDYQRLKIFTIVCRTGNFTRAAQELGISQPAVSLSMKELEKSLGLTLFVRNENDVQRTMDVTPAAETFLSFAQRVIKSHDDIDTVFHADTIGYEKVTIGAGKSACELVVPQVLATLRAIYPKIEFEVIEMDEDVCGDVATGTVNDETDIVINAISRREGGRFVMSFTVKEYTHPLARVVGRLLDLL